MTRKTKKSTEKGRQPAKTRKAKKAAVPVTAAFQAGAAETAPAGPVVPENGSVAHSAPLEPAWQVVGAAVKGISHERTGTPCQDAQAYQVLPDGTLLIALADGAGSARFSDQGAGAAVRAALSALADVSGEPQPDEAGWREKMREVFDAARQAVLQLADETGEWLRDYASTLTCVISTGAQLVVGQIGDGAVVALDEQGDLFTATRLQRGEYANETHFLVQEDALEQLTVDVVQRPISALAVMSDGLIRLALKMPSQEPHVPFFQPLFGFIRSLEQDTSARANAADQLSAFLGSERVNARTDDDKSLVLAARAQTARLEPVAAGPVETAPKTEKTVNASSDIERD